VHGQSPAHVVGEIFIHVLLVLTRQDQLADAVPACREYLFFDAANGQHPSRQRDLAGHRDVAAHGTA